jgi:hypothetical protein
MHVYIFIDDRRLEQKREGSARKRRGLDDDMVKSNRDFEGI